MAFKVLLGSVAVTEIARECCRNDVALKRGMGEDKSCDIAALVSITLGKDETWRGDYEKQKAN